MQSPAADVDHLLGPLEGERRTARKVLDIAGAGV